MSGAVGVDVGATKIAAAVVDEAGDVLEWRSVPTPCGVDALLDTVVDLVTGLVTGHGELPVGVGAAAYLSRDRSTVRFAPNLPWRDLPLATVLQDRLSLPVVLENDANAAAWGEYRHGAGQGVEDLLLVTVGTGVGGGLVLDGRLPRGGFGLAGEIGHVRVVPGGEPCGCGARGCLEAHASGTALARDARQAAGADEAAARPLLARAGSPERIDGRLVSEVAAAGDPFARSCLARVGRFLGEGLASVASVADPARVLVGGGVASAGDLLLDPLREVFAEALPGAGRRPVPEVLAASLGERAGVVGAAELARGRE